MARNASLAGKAVPAPVKSAVPVQKKLAVGPARDRFEGEADRIADRIAARGPDAAPVAPPAISRLPMAAVQRAPAKGGSAPAKEEEVKDASGKPLSGLAQRATKAPVNAAQAQKAQAAKRAPVKTTKVKDEEEDKGTAVQRKADGPSAAPAGAEHAIGRMRAAGGAPMAAPVQRQMEGGLGRSLSGVRIHSGAGAARAAKSVGARAFTVGNDVFFGTGQYRPDTPGGARLLAHELVHTQQQKGLGNMAQTKALQRDPEPEGNGGGSEAEDEGPGMLFEKPGDRNTKIELTPSGQPNKMEVPVLEVPKIARQFKGAVNHAKGAGVADTEARKNNLDPGALPFIYRGKTGRGSDTARQQFLRDRFFQESENRTEPRLASLLPEQVRQWNREESVLKNAAGEDVRYLRLRRRGAAATTNIIYGTAAQIADHDLIKMPNWDFRGEPASFDVDHALELQLGGLDGWNNFWLLNQSANRSSGAKIHNSLKRNIEAVINAANAANFWRGANASEKPTYDAIRQGNGTNWEVTFRRIRELNIASADGPYWSIADISAGTHLRQLVTLTGTELVNEGLRVEPGTAPNRFSIFADRQGGFRQVMNIRNGEVRPRTRNTANFFYGFDYTGATINPAETKAPFVTHLSGRLFKKARGDSPLQELNVAGNNGIPILTDPSLGYSGFVDKAALADRIRNLASEIAGASPVSFQQAGINAAGQIFATGTIGATKALFPGLQIPIYVEGSDIFIEFPIPTERLSFGPVSVTEAALQLGVGEGGVFVEGNAKLAVDQLGTGEISARVERGNTILSGAFNFDLDFLDPASAEIVYNYGQDTLSLTLNAGVGEGRLPGVEQGEFTATFSRDAVSFSGSMTLGGPLSGVVVTASYSAENGLRLGADNIQLPVERIPGVSSATASLYASRNPETGEWSFGGAGTAVLGIAGATGTINIAVDGDRVLFTGNLAVAKGPASGSLRFTATNAPIDEEGNPAEGEVGSEITVFGRGDVEITFGRVLKGTAGIELTPQANIILRGSIGLPPTFEVFPKQEFDKKLLTVETPDFPIWGVSLGGVGIGIFAFADATLSFNAFVGPGQLVDTRIGAEMDLDRPEDATITGSARFTVPAFAGFNLDVGGGLRARVAVAYVEGRVGLDCELGIAADASASVDVNWNRTDGLNVEAAVEANAQPKFRVGVNASVTAGVDLLLTEISKTWGPWRKTLGEFGPDMAMGVKVPVKWNEEKGVDFKLEDIEIKKPEFNVRDILKSSFEELV